MALISTNAIGLDRRKRLRISYPFKLMHAPYVFPGIKNSDLHPGEIINISALGIRFKSPLSYQPASLARVEIKLGSWSNFKSDVFSYREIYQAEPFVALGKILRVNECLSEEGEKYFETALSFISADEQHILAVDRFIKNLITKKGNHENTCS